MITHPPTISSPITRLSPASLERLLACPLRVAFDQAQARTNRGHTATSPTAALGKAVHLAIEMLIDDRTVPVERAWASAIDEIANVDVDPRSAPGARRAYLRLERRYPQLVDYIDARRPTTTLREEFLASPDGEFSGQLDLLLIGPHPTVIDHKTGTALDDDGAPVEEYARQLAIYAWLAEACHGVKPREGALFSLRDGVIEVDLAESAVRDVIDGARRARDEYNARGGGHQPATPSSAACARCPHLAACPHPWDAFRSGALDTLGWGHAILGTVLSVALATSGAAAVTIHTTTGNQAGEATIIDVPATEAAELAMHSPVAAWNLALRSGTPLILAWTDASRIANACWSTQDG